MGGPVIVEIGRIRVTSTTVWTPTGEFPLRGSEWTATDEWVTEQRRPPWATVLAIAGTCVAPVVSLLFLRVRRPATTGVLLVSVHNGPYGYSARIPVADQARAQALRHQVEYARSLALL